MNRIFKRINYRLIARKLAKRSDVSGDHQFFFVVSAGRSGSTLMRKHLLGNEKIGIPPESDDLMPMIAKIWLSRGTYEEKVDRIIHKASQKKCMSFWSLDWDLLKRNLLSKSQSERRLAEVIMEIYRTGSPNKSIFGDKTPYLVYYLNWLVEIFPNAKFIYLIRDGRAVVNSYFYSRGYTIEQACDRWNAGISSFVKSNVFKQNKFLLIKYEDFVSETSKVMHNLCNYLEIPFEKAMLTPPNVDLGDGHLSHHKNVSNAINLSSLDKWKAQLTKEQIDLIEKRLDQNLRKFSYNQISRTPDNRLRMGVIFSHHIYFSPSKGGSVARWVYEVVDKSTSLDDVTVFIPSDRSSEVFTTSHINVKTVKTLANTLASVKKDSLLLKKITFRIWLRSVMKNIGNIEVLLIENRPEYAIILRKLGYRGKIIVHLHNELLRQNSPVYYDALNQSVDKIISCSEAVISPLKKYAPDLYEKCEVVYNGVDTSLFAPAPNVKKDNIILFVGRIVEQKGLHLLLSVYEKLLIEIPNVQLKLAGSATFGGDDELTDYEKLVQRRVDEINGNGGHVEMLGYVEHDVALPKLYNEATVFCLSSLDTEAFPFVTLEAMFCGTAVVAPKMGGIPEAFSNEEFLYEAGNEDDLYRKLLLVLKDSDKRESSQNFNYAYAKKNFTWDKIVESFDAFLSRII